MKTLSQNTTSSACAPETDLQQLVATIVPDEQRISFWPQHFGLIPQWVALEPRVFGWMDRLCEDYCGGIWNLYTLNNGGAFMWICPYISRHLLSLNPLQARCRRYSR
ncbi:hypothetical protein RNQ75_21520, partial [Escherichia coli]|nr:hypothetical protein [Escherichia coli]